MSKKDYALICEIIGRLPHEFTFDQCWEIANHFAIELNALSPGFRKDIFLSYAEQCIRGR